ncbi:hypothetical protein SPAB_02418 [Salmonella enterica subsp. enterica serovar Paratyphi B str. SPB7]|uniref:Uncharacterized protein n=1 Tax=Salmonella paratyphi B (strain ATCC BAA-1250 / SPB7) TaxID=1016998 RepID=A0A6C6Z3D5_SALPB|nr:hypothetical protein SPAB_02418 [Salmonella enterica subsp. enterica serovar Paratyphi B str. SPB7]
MHGEYIVALLMFCVVLSSNSGSSPAVMVTHYGDREW